MMSPPMMRLRWGASKWSVDADWIANLEQSFSVGLFEDLEGVIDGLAFFGYADIELVRIFGPCASRDGRWSTFEFFGAERSFGIPNHGFGSSVGGDANSQTSHGLIVQRHEEIRLIGNPELARIGIDAARGFALAFDGGKTRPEHECVVIADGCGRRGGRCTVLSGAAQDQRKCRNENRG